MTAAEGRKFGTDTKRFRIAGSVIVYGMIYGVVYSVLLNCLKVVFYFEKLIDQTAF
ncbi:MAG: hypothetical protein IJE19_10090 [Clostridia bacterium]|nr:hypothetical protein [Clostridia bacterium]